MSFSAPTALVAQEAADTAAERKKQEGQNLPLEEGRITAGMAYDTQPRYSPDGTQLVFISDRSGGDNLWTLDLATGDTTQVTTGNGSAWMSPDWTPDGDYIVASKGATRLGVGSGDNPPLKGAGGFPQHPSGVSERYQTTP